MKQLTIVTYHYVRPIKNSLYPRIKGLEIEGFKRQLDYFSNRYTFITAEQLIAHSLGNEELPINSCYLTFDDGFKDHVKYVMPELLARKIQGSFFPIGNACVKKELDAAHAIHFILESVSDYHELVDELDEAYLGYGGTSSSLVSMKNTWYIADRYDPPPVNYIKHMLQEAIPLNIRSKIVSNFFKKYIGKTQSDFAEELYLSISDIKTLIENGMYIGCHGYNHLKLCGESQSSQILEIDLSLQFLKKVGAPTKDWIMCYPYGKYNKNTLNILKSKNCSIGLTINPGLADLDQSNMLELRRLDTNKFPQ